MDGGYRTRDNAVSGSDLSLVFTITDTLPDGDHVGIGEFGGALSSAASGVHIHPLATKNTVAVGHVFGRADDFQIHDTVVIFDAVDMIDVKPLGNSANECFGDPAMNLAGFDLGRSSADSYNGVAVFISPATDDLAASANNTAFAGNLVADVRYVFPNFHGASPVMKLPYCNKE